MSGRSIRAGGGFVEIGIRSRLKKGANAVQSDLNALGKKLQQRGAGIARVGLTLAAGSAGILAGPIKAASEMQETMGKFGVVFGEATSDVKSWSDQTAAAVGVSRQSMASMLSGMQDLLVPMGVLPDTATGMSKELSKLAVDLGSFNNMGTDQVMGDLMAAMTGSGEVMKKYGVILSETSVKQELLNQGLDPKEAGNAAKAQARLNIIMRGTTAAQGDAVRTADSFANQTKGLWAVLTDTAGVLGGPILEDLAALISIGSSGIVAFRDFAEQNEGMLRVVGLSIVAVGGLGGALIAVGGSMAAAGIAAGGLATVIGLIASPIGVTIAAMAGLGYAVVNYTDIASKGVAFLQERFGPLVDTVKGAGEAIMAALQTGDIDQAWEIAVSVMELVWLDLTSGIRDAWSDVMSFVLDAGSNMADGIGQLFVSLGDMLEGLLDGYASYYDTVYDKVVELGGKVTGVKTIGEKSSAFESNFGDTRDSLKQSISQIKVFGETISDSAAGQREARSQANDQASKERAARIEALRTSINVTSAEIITKKETADAAKAAKDAGSGLDAELKAAEAKTRFETSQKGINEESRSGPTGTFNAFAASFIGAGPTLEREQLNVMKEISKNTAKTARQKNVARFA